MALAPSMVSSEGWPMSISVPCHLSHLIAAMARAVPISTVVWTSCPQACMTPTAWPDLSLHEDVAGVGDAGLFDDGKRIHVGTDEQRRARAVLEDGDDAVGLRAIGIFADVLGDGVAALRSSAASIAEVCSSKCDSSGCAWRSL